MEKPRASRWMERGGTWKHRVMTAAALSQHPGPGGGQRTPALLWALLCTLGKGGNDGAEPWKAGVGWLQAGSVLLLPLCVLRDCVI